MVVNGDLIPFLVQIAKVHDAGLDIIGLPGHPGAKINCETEVAEYLNSVCGDISRGIWRNIASAKPRIDCSRSSSGMLEKVWRLNLALARR